MFRVDLSPDTECSRAEQYPHVSSPLEQPCLRRDPSCHIRTIRPEAWGRGAQSLWGCYLKASRVDDLVADGALHEHEVKLAFFLFHCVLLPGLATHKAHGSVGQHWLRTQRTCKSSGSEDRPHWGLHLSGGRKRLQVKCIHLSAYYPC